PTERDPATLHSHLPTAVSTPAPPPPPPGSPLFPYTTLFRSGNLDIHTPAQDETGRRDCPCNVEGIRFVTALHPRARFCAEILNEDRKSTRLNSSHLVISYAVFCLKKKRMSV